MAQVTNVSGTAFVVAEFRAEENDEAYPLYRDPIVKLFLSEESRQAADRIAAVSAGKRDGQDQNPVLR